jgi:DNA-binding YbaB/EbfC family protein
VFKGLANLGSLLQQARQIGGKMQGLSEELRRQRVVGSAGGGMVEIEVNGLMEVLGCHVDQQLVDQRDRELLEDLVVTAVNQAILKGKQLHSDAMKSMAGGLEIPGLDQALGKFLGVNEEEQPQKPDDPDPPT